MPATETARVNIRQSERLAAALHEAGALALKTFRGNVRSWTKARNSPVCEADIAVDAFLREKLTTSDVGWLSEESVDDPSRLSQNRIFIVDPIDGTRSYLAGRPDWSIAAALVENGRPVVGAIYAPVDDELFVAISGEGVTLNGVAIAASGGAELAQARVAGPKRHLDQMSRLGAPIATMPKIHSLALRLARVAQGRIDAAFVSANSHDWDLAAADLLVHEAGGTLTTLDGRSLVYNRPETTHGALMAAGRARHQTMLDFVRPHWQEFA